MIMTIVIAIIMMINNNDHDNDHNNNNNNHHHHHPQHRHHHHHHPPSSDPSSILHPPSSRMAFRAQQPHEPGGLSGLGPESSRCQNARGDSSSLVRYRKKMKLVGNVAGKLE